MADAEMVFPDKTIFLKPYLIFQIGIAVAFGIFAGITCLLSVRNPPGACPLDLEDLTHNLVDHQPSQFASASQADNGMVVFFDLAARVVCSYSITPTNQDLGLDASQSAIIKSIHACPAGCSKSAAAGDICFPSRHASNADQQQCTTGAYHGRAD